MNFVKKVLENGGSIKPLIIPSEDLTGTGLLNPSIFIDEYENILVNVRHIQYTLYHAEKNKYEHQWGPLVYIHPEDDLTLTTTNYLCQLDKNLDISFYKKVDTSKLDVNPLWEFVGLEDARLVRWDEKYYLCGVRRDTTHNGQGRMELSEIEITRDHVKEVSRVRIPAPGNNDSYCEKNWVPVLDQPYHFVKWTNPTEVVKFDVDSCTTEQIHLGEYKQMPADLRGGSQVMPYKDGYITLNHETYLYNSETGRKDGSYKHRFTYWDKNWNVISYSENFDFLGAKIEFCCGLTKYKNNFLITFGFQDNAAYILSVPEKIIEDIINA